MLAYIGLGSNLGDPLENCRRALEEIAAAPGNRVVRCSPLYRTEPVGKKDQDWFLNGVVVVETKLPPRKLLAVLLAIEKKMGRERRERWGPRLVDLDLLFYGGQVVRERSLRVPHPRAHERRFVLIPLKDVAPRLKHPLLGKTVSRMLQELPAEEEVVPLRGARLPLCPV